MTVCANHVSPPNTRGKPVKIPPDPRAFALAVLCARCLCGFLPQLAQLSLQSHLLSKALPGCSIWNCSLLRFLPVLCPPCQHPTLSDMTCILRVLIYLTSLECLFQEHCVPSFMRLYPTTEAMSGILVGAWIHLFEKMLPLCFKVQRIDGKFEV